MIGSVRAAVYRPLTTTSSHHRPWQIASAVAGGTLCGLLLMKSPLGLLLLACLYCLPIQLPVAAATAVLVSLASVYFFPMLGQLGVWTLGMEQVANLIGRLNSYPLVPWLRLNNTLVQGGLLVGMIQFLPTFYVVRRLMINLQGAWESELQQRWIRFDRDHAQQLAPRISYVQRSGTLAAESETDWDSTTEPDFWIPDEFRSTAAELEFVEPAVAEGSVEPEWESELAGTSEPDFDEETLEIQEPTIRLKASCVSGVDWVENDGDSIDPSTAIERLETQLGERQSSQELKVEEVVARAAELTQLVDELLAVIQGEHVKAALDLDVAETVTAEEVDSLGGELSTMDSELAGETSIASRPRFANSSQLDLDGPSGQFDAGRDFESNPVRAHEAHTNKRRTEVVEAPGPTTEVANHDESLHYLLHHLREIKNRI